MTILSTRIRQTLGLVVVAGCVLLPGRGRAGADRRPHRHRQGRRRRRASGRDRPGQLSRADWRPQDPDHERERATALPGVAPGVYVLDVELTGFAAYHEEDIRIGAGATIERTVELTLAGFAESVVVEGAGSRIDARDTGFRTRFGAEDLDAIPMRRLSSYDWVKTAPGISPTSPAGGSMLVSAFGSGVDQNQFLIDGTNVTAPTQRRRTRRSGHRLHSRTADPIRGRVR